MCCTFRQSGSGGRLVRDSVRTAVLPTEKVRLNSGHLLSDFYEDAREAARAA
jgi:hypothetical protein